MCRINSPAIQLREDSAHITRGGYLGTAANPPPRSRPRPVFVFHKPELHAAFLEYNWNGQGIDAVFEVNQLL